MQYDFISYPIEAWNRAVQVTRLILKSTRVRIDFTKEGWRQFTQLNQSRGSAFIRAINIASDLALYIAAHEERNIPLDTECLELCYQPGIFLILRKEHGVWYITDVFTSGEDVGFIPVFFWKRIKRGCSTILAHVLVAWRRLTTRDEGTHE